MAARNPAGIRSISKSEAAWYTPFEAECFLRLADESVVYDRMMGATHHLGPVASEVLDQLLASGPATTAALVRACSGRVAGDFTVDLEPILEALKQLGLVARSPALP